MANEAIWKTTSQVTLASSGASMATNAGPTLAGTLATSSHFNYPLADFVLNATLAASHASGSYIQLYARALNIDGTGDADAQATSARLGVEYRDGRAPFAVDVSYVEGLGKFLVALMQALKGNRIEHKRAA